MSLMGFELLRAGLKSKFTPKTTNMTMEDPPFEDVFPIETYI